MVSSAHSTPQTRRLMPVMVLVGLCVAPGWGVAKAAPAPPKGVAAARPAKGPAPRRPAVTRRYSLPKLVSLARAKAPGLRVARARVKMAEASLLKAQLLWVPKVSTMFMYAPISRVKCVVPESFRDVPLAGGGTLYDVMSTQDQREKFCLGTDATDTALDFFQKFRPENYFFRWSLSLNQPLYTFGRIRFAKKLARTAVNASKQRVRAARIGAIGDVRRAYFGLKLARELLFIVDEGWEYLRKAQKRVNKGLDDDSEDVDLTDKYRLQILVAQVRDQTLQLKRAERLALAALRAVIGRSLPKGFDIDKKPLGAIVAAVKPLATYVALAKKHRPEFQLLGLAVQASRQQVKLRRSQFAPDLGLAINVAVVKTNSPDDPQNAYLRDGLHGTTLSMALVLKWDLDFHFKYAELAKARAQLVASRHRREQASLGLELQIAKAHGEFETAGKRMSIQRKAQKAARRWLITMSQRHDIGTGSTKQLTDALKAYFQSQMRGHQATYEFNLAAATLSRMVGLDVTTDWAKRAE